MAQALAGFFGVGPKELVSLVMKHGPSWILLAYLVYFLTNGVGADVRESRAEHRELGFYLRAICVGINKDTPNGWQMCQPPAESHSK